MDRDEMLRKLADAAETHMRGGVAPLSSLIDEARSLLASKQAQQDTTRDDIIYEIGKAMELQVRDMFPEEAEVWNCATAFVLSLGGPSVREAPVSGAVDEPLFTDSALSALQEVIDGAIAQGEKIGVESWYSAETLPLITRGGISPADAKFIAAMTPVVAYGLVNAACAALQPAQTAPSQDGEAAALRQKLANSEYVKRMKDDLIAHLRAQISTARADGFAQCKEMAKTELRKERDASKDYEGVSLAYNGALSLINALQCPEQPASQQPSAPTDISKRLRQYGVSGDVSDGALLIQAADEIERYYGGMLAWKATAEAKDREAAREQPAAPSEDKPVEGGE